ncbi:MAG: hypothetical protein A2161_03585 [Candidatus Schekmanbacteria bacterium RBG_13_48_7]|uniref:Ribosome maturation factor RimP n=1 Tax=Candidatus Schekmanbacteria bacterium RBG_13_48_7 TaxID=1817878 RepID=A0A1F7RNV9_9BACT|nr:MAG: hypothetical protein A2161_03585 [Candidatus Schekmanbacteria bacterium RBG_13_48_7]
MIFEADKKTLISNIEQIVTPILQDAGFELVEVQLSGMGRSRVLRIFIDSEDGVTIRDCVKMSEEMSVNLDVANPLEGSYILEVSSPGLDRPLQKERDFRRCIGKKIYLNLKNPCNNETELTGQLIKAENGLLTIKCGKTKLYEISLQEIQKAKIQF